VRLSDVQHQGRAISILRRSLGSGRTHHAYLFEGPEGVGKQMAAKALAARLLCLSTEIPPDADACGACAACRLFASGNHPDFHLIERSLHKLHPDRTIRASKGLFLVVDVIRTFLIEPASNKPTVSSRRVFLVNEAERMNEGAQNALLKTLEEPPGQTCLILVTSSAERLLPTIRSRCQRVPFGLLPPEFVAQQLSEHLRLPAESAAALARLADGRLGAAIRWEHARLLEGAEEVAGSIERLERGGPTRFSQELMEIGTALAGRLAEADSQADGEGQRDEEVNDSGAGEDAPADESGDEGVVTMAGRRSGARALATSELRDALKLVLMLVAAIYRDALLVSVGAESGLHLAAQRPHTKSLSQRNSAARLDNCIRAVGHAERMLDRNVAPPLVGEYLGAALLGTAPVPTAD
jgi:DNA polymerase-3 subunit delta'